ncbi:MAG TPA: HAMP domain-containing sensor histidine kinase [Anaeromyxobacteraceae bacterium]|nr:HAMP domain-containing sensor histidine kinase [Anaeromyxobacteraceae bacterium]
MRPHHLHGCRGPGPGWRHRRAGIFWRVYGHGLLLLALVMLAVAGAGWALGRAMPGREPGRLAAYAASRVAELASDRARLGEELRRVREGFELDISVYDGAGALVATNVEPPLPPVAPADRARLRAGPFRVPVPGFTWAAPLPDGGGHLVVTGVPRDGALTRVAVFIAVVLLVLAVGSIPLARSISSPVERLTAAARALGAGDLSVRAGVRARGEVGELAAAFDDMAGRLEALVRSEKELLANVSHELRTPLARIRVALALAEEGDVARARQALGEIGDDLGELERLVDEILAAARLDLAGAGGLPLHRERLDPVGLVEEAAHRFRARHPERALEVAPGDGLPELEADPALLRRLLGNLLDNAAKYSEAPAPVRLSARAAEEGLVLEVRDHGIGVDEADLARLFTPFFRTDRSRARGTGGVGLGLALARRIAEAHGGRIAAEPAPGGGTVFRVTLPAAA